MSYTPTEWSNGDVITAEKLNKLEQGIADSDFITVIFEYRDSYVYSSYTPIEMGQLLEQGKTIFAKLKYPISQSNTFMIYSTFNCNYSTFGESEVVEVGTIQFIFSPDYNGPRFYINAYDNGETIAWQLVA